MYTTLPIPAKDKKSIPNEQVARDTVATVLEKSTLDAKKVGKHFD